VRTAVEGIEIYQCPEGHKRAGRWTFRVGGVESLYYTPTRAGVLKKITALESSPKAKVVLRAVKANAKRAGDEAAAEPEPPARDMASFMKRGKLAGVQRADAESD
jgi:hypothetical protein